MLRISRLTDYGTLVLSQLAKSQKELTSASVIAEATGVKLPTVSKLLKLLAKAEIVTSARGANGGYRLSRNAGKISAADIIDALEGPINITECTADHYQCNLESNCNLSNAWNRVNSGIIKGLAEISLKELQSSSGNMPNFKFSGMPVNIQHTMYHHD